MKTVFYLFIALLFFSCTSNTILEKPKDLIPKDTMQFLIQDMWIASSAAYIKNIRQEKNIKYMAFVYDKYKIDSTRFQTSNRYYVSDVDTYFEIISKAKDSLEKQKDYYTKLNMKLDSIRRDSIDKIKYKAFKLDSIKKDSLKKTDLEMKKSDLMKKKSS